MSHITKIKAEIKDLEALKQATEAVGLRFNENKHTYKHYYGNGTCDHSISVPEKRNAYEIGVVKKDQDSYSLELDEFSGGYGLIDLAGNGCENIVDEYTKSVARKQANVFCNENGFTYQESFDEKTNETVITLRRY